MEVIPSKDRGCRARDGPYITPRAKLAILTFRACIAPQNVSCSRCELLTLL